MPMQLNFYINYRTQWGESVVVKLWNCKDKKPFLRHKYALETHNGELWFGSIDVLEKIDTECLIYEYVIEEGGYEKHTEWQTQKHLLWINNRRATQYNVFDCWNDMPYDTYLYTSAFNQCIIQRHEQSLMPSSFASTLRISVRAPQLRTHHKLAIVGDTSCLGKWQPKKALLMTETQTNLWTIDLDASALQDSTITFKFVAINTKKPTEVMWETGENRTLEVSIIPNHVVHCVTQHQAFFALCDIKLAGTAVPLFSLRTEKSFGVGDFGDLKKMIDFVSATHQRVLQLLPINDSTATHTWLDSYPYSCVSVFALHPQYICLHALPALTDKTKKAHFERLQKELNQLSEIDYEAVNNAKNDYLTELYKQNGKEVLASDSFKVFFKDNEHWLLPYAQYCALRDANGTCNFDEWPTQQRWDDRLRKALSTASTEEYKAVAYYYYVQYLLFTQMQEAHRYAQSKQVVLKGDIPIGVHPHGSDVWMEPKYFHRDSQAGAPPDDFAVNGQNWGFPTYNWDEMLKDNCEWWRRRFTHMSVFFDAYRIDHVLGFFRIWDIPISSVDALSGQFSPAIAMSKGEIEQAGFYLNEPLLTTPVIAEHELGWLFGASSEKVKQNYLMSLDGYYYTLKPDYNTQRKVEKAFKDATNDEDRVIENGLYILLNNVLFVKDKHREGYYHPRIVGYKSIAFDRLEPHLKYAFSRIHDDYFYHRNEGHWRYEALKKLPLLVQATNMLVCAEDLGMVPACVKDVMDQLRMFSLEIETMPKDTGIRFGNVRNYPYRSVCTISTHDMATLRQWWDENEEQTQCYYNHVLYQHGPAPHPLTGHVASMVVQNHLNSPSCLCVLSLQDWLSIDENIRLSDANKERINVPANPRHYWRYRLHLNIDELLQNHDYINKVQRMVEEGNRRVF